MSYEESYAKAFPFDKMIPGMLDPEMIKDTARIVNEAIQDKLHGEPNHQQSRRRQCTPDRPEDRG